MANYWEATVSGIISETEMLQIQVETGVASLRLLPKGVTVLFATPFPNHQHPLPEMKALRERAFLPALDGHELTAVVPTVTFLVARNRVIMSAPTRVIEQHFAFSILFHTRLINEVCQCRRVFVTPNNKIQVRSAWK
jgi:hypothetical protein